jgi:hypothetical protein
MGWPDYSVLAYRIMLSYGYGTANRAYNTKSIS